MATRHPNPFIWKFRDLTGLIFGRLLVLAYAGKQPGNNSLCRWRCQCQCGRIAFAST